MTASTKRSTKLRQRYRAHTSNIAETVGLNKKIISMTLQVLDKLADEYVTPTDCAKNIVYDVDL